MKVTITCAPNIFSSFNVLSPVMPVKNTPTTHLQAVPANQYLLTWCSLLNLLSELSSLVQIHRHPGTSLLSWIWAFRVLANTTSCWTFCRWTDANAQKMLDTSIWLGNCKVAHAISKGKTMGIDGLLNNDLLC